jgi:hypothetical protein
VSSGIDVNSRSSSAFYTRALGNSRFRNAPNESTIAFDKGEFVSEASFEQDGYAMVTRQVGSCGEGNILSDPHMGEPNEFCQNVQTSGNG